MSEMLRIEGLQFAVQRSPRRRTVGVTVGRDGELSVAAPHLADISQVEKAVRGKLFWVFTKLAEKALMFRPGPEKEYVSGEGFSYLGRSYRLLITDAQADGEPAAGLRLVAGRFVMRRADQPNARKHFVRWYKNHTLDWVTKRLDLLAPRIGKAPVGVRVIDLGTRWGSCSRDGRLNFHWKVICLPPSLVEYVIAHELTHLIEPNHTMRFWKRLERAIPDYRERKRRLAESGGWY